MSERMVVPIHGEDHCPGGPDPIPCLSTAIPWARRSRGYADATQAVNSGTIATMVPLTNHNMGTGESGEDYFVANANGIQLLVSGVIAVKVGMQWTAGFANAVGIGFEDTASGGHWASFMHQTALSLSLEASFICRAPANRQFTMVVYQTSGSSKNIDGALLELMYLGTYTGTEENDMDPDQ